MIAMDAEMMLAAKGAITIETAASPAEALRKLAHFTPDAAVLDVNLGTETSLSVAEELARRQIPFVSRPDMGTISWSRNRSRRRPSANPTTRIRSHAR